MTLATGKRGTLTDRDAGIFLDLLLCGSLTLQQIAELRFASTALKDSTLAAKVRLHKLKRKGYVDSRPVGTLVRINERGQMGSRLRSFYHLTKEGHEAALASLRIPEELEDLPWGAPAVPPVPDPARAAHAEAVNDLYVVLRREISDSPDPPEWWWLNERRSARRGVLSNEPLEYVPDATLVLLGRTFVIERQTRRARTGPGRIYEKVEVHKKLLSTPAYDDPDATEMLFVCDRERDAESARRAGKQYGIALTAEVGPDDALSPILGLALFRTGRRA